MVDVLFFIWATDMQPLTRLVITITHTIHCSPFTKNCIFAPLNFHHYGKY